MVYFKGLPVVFILGGDKPMKDLKSTFIGIFKALYRPVVIPFFLLILFLLANQFFVIDSLFKEKIVLECEAYQRELEDAFLEVENKKQTKLENLFVDEYLQQSSQAFLKS